MEINRMKYFDFLFWKKSKKQWGGVKYLSIVIIDYKMSLRACYVYRIYNL